MRKSLWSKQRNSPLDSLLILKYDTELSVRVFFATLLSWPKPLIIQQREWEKKTSAFTERELRKQIIKLERRVIYFSAWRKISWSFQGNYNAKTWFQIWKQFPSPHAKSALNCFFICKLGVLQSSLNWRWHMIYDLVKDNTRKWKTCLINCVIIWYN